MEDKITTENLKNFQQWIQALRSGKFQKGVQFLLEYENSTPKFCILGVLEFNCLSKTKRYKNWDEGRIYNELHQKSWLTHPSLIKDNLGNYIYSLFFEAYMNIESSKLLFAVKKAIPTKLKLFRVIAGSRTHIGLTTLNDSTVLNLSFNELADLLEVLIDLHR